MQRRSIVIFHIQCTVKHVVNLDMHVSFHESGETACLETIHSENKLSFDSSASNKMPASKFRRQIIERYLFFSINI